MYVAPDFDRLRLNLIHIFVNWKMFNCISQHRENIDPKRCQPDDADAVAAFPDFRRKKESTFRSMLRKGRNTLHRLCIHATILVKNFVQIHQYIQFQ